MSSKSFKTATGDRQWLDAHGLASVSDVLAHRPPPAVALNRSSETFAIKLDGPLEGPQLLYVKRYHYRSLVRQLKQLFHGTLCGRHRGQFEFDFLEEMRRRSLPAIRPIACGADRRFGLLRASFLIVEGLDGAEALDRYSTSAGHLTRAKRRSLAEALSLAIRRLHEAGVIHGALAWRNILINLQSRSYPTFMFIDPARRGRILNGPVPTDRAAEELSLFIASAVAAGYKGGITHFMRSYWGKQRLDGADRLTVRRLVRSASKHVAEERRRMAVADTWRHVRKGMTGPTGRRGRRTIASADEFFLELPARYVHGPDIGPGTRRIRFLLREADGSAHLLRRLFIVKDRRMTVQQDDGADAHLTIESDEDTLLAIVNGHAGAAALIQEGRLRLDGDRSLVPGLVRGVGL